MDAIAAAAGSNKASLYRLFNSKERLAAEYLRERIREAWEHWDATIAPHWGNPRRQFEALFAAHRAKDKGSRGCALGSKNEASEHGKGEAGIAGRGGLKDRARLFPALRRSIDGLISPDRRCIRLLY